MSDNGKINVGDFVRYKNRDAISKVTIAKDGWVAIDTPVMTAESCLIEDVDRIDNKDAFLFEMQALLRKYDASVYVGFDQSDEVYTTTIAVGEDSVKYPCTCGIDADNIMDYDKE
jgi:hypothetical protein